MSDINEQIEEMADAMEKATNPKAQLFETIKKLGPEGIREKLLAKSEDGTPLLSDEDRVILKDALEEMNKAVSMDDAYQAKYVEGNINDTKLQEDKADDDQDEQLVKPAAATINHQGDVSPEGREGQVIKGKMKNKAMGDKDIDIADDAEETADEAVGKVKTNGQKKPRVMGDKMKKTGNVAKSLDERVEEIEKAGGMHKMMYKMCEKGYSKDQIMSKMCKAGDDKKKMGAMIDAAMAEHNKKMHAGEKMKKKGDHKMEKTYGTMEKSVDKEETVGSDKDDVMMNKEENQNGDTDKAVQGADRGDKSRPKDLKVEEENKEAQDSVNDLKQGQQSQMRKAVWDDGNALLKSGRGGQNFHFNVNNYYDDALAKANPEKPEEQEPEALEKSEQDQKEEVKKAEPKQEKFDINDLIAKSMDKPRHDVINDSLLAVKDDHTKDKFVRKSFGDNEIAEALGLSEEEAKKILGE